MNTTNIRTYNLAFSIQITVLITSFTDMGDDIVAVRTK